MPEVVGPISPILITGATGAIGGAVAASLCADDRPLVLWVRDRNRGEEVRRRLLERRPAARVELVEGDLGCLAEVSTVATRVASIYPRLGAVVHAAGVLTRRREETPEGLERMFATNHLGPFCLTRQLLGRLDPANPFRVLTVTPPSTTPVDFSDLFAQKKFRSLPVFAASKSASLLFAYGLARRLGRGPRTSNAFFPGVVRSALVREAPALVRAFVRAVGAPADRAGESLAWLATGAPLASATGAFFEGTRVGSSSEYARDVAVQDRLWAESERIVSETLGHAAAPPLAPLRAT